MQGCEVFRWILWTKQKFEIEFGYKDRVLNVSGVSEAAKSSTSLGRYLLFWSVILRYYYHHSSIIKSFQSKWTEQSPRLRDEGYEDLEMHAGHGSNHRSRLQSVKILHLDALESVILPYWHCYNHKVPDSAQQHLLMMGQG